MVGLPHGTLQSCGRIYWFNRCSMCCRWQYCCLLDLFMHDDGPALRSKVAHATVHLDAMLDQDTDPHLARLCEVLAVCFVSICATIRMQRIQAHCDGMMRGTYLPDDTTGIRDEIRSEEHTSELQSLMRISYAVFCLKKKKRTIHESRMQIQPTTT